MRFFVSALTLALAITMASAAPAEYKGQSLPAPRVVLSLTALPTAKREPEAMISELRRHPSALQVDILTVRL